MQDLILHGNKGEYETRSDADFAACIAMFGAGYEAPEVWAVMTDPFIHLLANDAGCVWRHAYDPETGAVSPFRSGYVNRPCKPGDAAPNPVSPAS